MASLDEDLEDLATTLKTQFNLLAAADLNDPEQAARLIELSAHGEELQDTLAKSLNIDVTSPLETLTKILNAAEDQGRTSSTQNFREALAQLSAIKAEWPENACATIEAVQDAAKHAQPPKP